MTNHAARPSWRIRGYRAEELIGFGGSGEVWRGRAANTGETVALKRLRRTDRLGQARLLHEAEVLRSLDHPHLIRLHEVVRDADEWVLVLDHAGGGSLAALLLERGRLRPGEVVSALAPIAAALAHAHTAGLMHGDVTPANIVFDTTGLPLLTDLGLARCVRDPAEPGLPQVTPEYVDPAVAAGAPPSPASDVFGLGAVAWHALVGSPLWTGPSAQETVWTAAAGVVPDLAALRPDAPADLVALLQRVTAPDPAARGSAGEFALELRHACRPEPVELADRPTTVPETARPLPLTHRVRPAPRHRAPGADSRRTRAAARAKPRGWRSVLTRPRLAGAGLALVSLVAAVRLGTSWAGGDSGPAAAVMPPAGDSPSPPAVARWTAVLDRLDQTRAAAFARGDPATLAAVYTEHCPARAVDATALAHSHGVRVVGARHRILRLRVLSAGTDAVTLAVTEQLAAYQLRADGHSRSVPAGPARDYQVRLRSTGLSWRIDRLQLR